MTQGVYVPRDIRAVIVELWREGNARPQVIKQIQDRYSFTVTQKQLDSIITNERQREKATEQRARLEAKEKALGLMPFGGPMPEPQKLQS